MLFAVILGVYSLDNFVIIYTTLQQSEFKVPYSSIRIRKPFALEQRDEDS
jgi:hypothetical protein